MSIENATARVIVVANEKGGSGKSTIAMHLAVALIKAGQRVATIDLDSRQRSFTSYIENRRAWARHNSLALEIPDHICPDVGGDPAAEDEAAASKIFTDAAETLSGGYDFVVIDTPGHNNYLMRRAHFAADILITPLNDSFVDFDVLGTIDPVTLEVIGTGHYAQMVDDTRRQRQQADNVTADWIVLRNRLSNLGSRNKRLVGEGLQELSRRLNFRCVEGLAERLIFREFFPRGLTALDNLNEATLGTRPTLSHATARLEIENLLNALRLGIAIDSGAAGNARDAA
jgi:chromosome partitioning protein